MNGPLARWILTTFAAALLLTLGGAAGAAEDPGRSDDTAGPVGSYSVTLITGDRVDLGVFPNGEQTATVEPSARGADAAELTFEILEDEGDLYVIPSDAALYVDGKLDRELFNVTELVAQGFHDGASESLPVIVDFEYAVGTMPAGLDRVAVLESIDAAVASEPRSKAAAFGRAVARQAANDSRDGRTGDARAAGQEPGVFAGIDRVWLDTTVEVTLDESVPQIGAPAAHAAGYDGTGVTVAVLDTGIDADHPDVAGKIVASRSFVPGESVADGHGHGTHVASIVAGSGTASAGRYAGVAPGAQLVIGKAINNSGTGPSSQVIAAMEWAAIEQDADVVNLSLGSQTPMDGTDPASQAVNSLTASTGALFVIASGNLGPSPYTVAAPGAATAALTVGAVDKSDVLAGFSSRGPRLGDHALKPELTAPGVSITAARAAGTTLGTPVDERYTTASGTSMATPHVAGGAAILAQQRPTWTPAQLKAALVATSDDGGFTVYQQGAGRLDVARAVRQEPQVSPATADFGFFPWPQEGPSATRTLTYSNPTDADVTFALALSATSAGGDPVPPAALALDTGTVTVPAGGSATATLTLDPTAVAAGLYSGRVVATAPGGVQLSTPVGFVIDEEKFIVGVRTLERELVDQFTIINVHLFGVDGSLAGDSLSRNCLPGCPDPVEFVVPAGTYSARVWVRWVNASGATEYGVLLDPEVVVDDETEVVLDADAAESISFDTAYPAEPLRVSPFSVFRSTADGSQRLINLLVGGAGALKWSVTPTEPVTEGEFWITSHWLLGAPVAEGTPPYVYQLKLFEEGRVPDSLSYRFGEDDVASVDNYFHASEPELPVNLTWFSRREGEFAVGGFNLDLTAPSTLREYVGPLTPDLVHERILQNRPRTFIPRDTALDVFAETGRREIHWNTQPVSPGALSLPPGYQVPRTDAAIIGYPFWVCAGCRQGDAFYPFMHGTSHEEHHEVGRYGTPFGGDTIRLYRDGVEIPQAPPFIGAFTTYELPPESARYRMTLDHLSSHTAWEFTSGAVTEDETPPGFWCFETFFVGATTPCRAEPLIFLRYDAGVDLRNTRPAPGAHQLLISAYRQAPAAAVPPLAALRLWLSTDDGASWSEVQATKRGGGVYKATLHYPKLANTTGRVSLRAEAWDTAGNRVEQTLIGAYGLREVQAK